MLDERHPVYISKKGYFHESDGSLVCPENLIDKWAFESRFVATRGIVSAFSSRDHLSSVYDPPLLLGSGLRLND